MDPGATVIRYQRDVLSRWALAVVGPVALGCWIAVIAKTGETQLIPLVIAISAGITAGTWWIGAAPCVALTPDALVIRSIRGTETLAWSDIAALERRMNIVWAMTSRGWYVLPVTSTRLADGRPTGIRSMGDQVWFTWLERRGDDWGYTPLDPWSPTRDMRGRAVLRPPLLPRLAALTITVNALAISMVPMRDPATDRLSTQLGGAALVFALTLAGVVAYHLWARVTIDAHEVITRSLSGGVTRIALVDVLEIRECSGRAWFGGRTVTRLGLLVADRPLPGSVVFSWPPWRVVELAAPVSVPLTWANDPAFYRIWTWLYDELVGDDRAAMADPALGSSPSDDATG